MTKRTTREHVAPFQASGLLRFLSAAGCLVAILLMSGCVATGPVTWIQNGFKVGPNYGRPPAPVGPEWIEANDVRVKDRQLRDGDWWNVFGDPALNSLVHTAFQQNPNLRAVGMRVLQARAQQAIAAGSLFPQTQEATGQYSRVALSHNAFNNPAAFSALNPNPVPPGVPIGNFYSDWTAGFNLSWELDFWGRYRRAIESANGSLDASAENYDDAIVTLLADVATNYVQFRVAQQRIKIARDNIQKQQEVVTTAERQAKVGTLAPYDVEQLRTLLEQTRSTIPALQIAQGQANDALCILLGVPPHDLEPELGQGPALESDPVPNTPAWVAAGVPADLLRRRPDIRSAERQAAAQSAQIGVAEADLYPTIFINGTLGWEAPDLSKLFESKSFFGSITPNFRWNILNYGRIVNNVHLQQAKTQELIATYQSKVLSAAQEVQTALRGFLQSQEQAENLSRAVKSAVAAADTGLQVFETKQADANRLYTLYNTRLQEQDNLAVVQGNVALNLISTYRALGGGWQIRCQARSTDFAADAAPPTVEPQQLPQPKGAPKSR
jgi:NodT family efflux transporter outer membrane factor (OMF) lipoprotein